MGGHRHVQLVGGRARACQVYPAGLVKAILTGTRLELTHSGILSIVYQDMLHVGSEDTDVAQYDGGQFIDDVSGQILDHKLVIIARKEEMAKYFEHKAYDKVPIEESCRGYSEGPHRQQMD